MFRGLSTVSVDTKGRLAIPARHRDQLAALSVAGLILTLNPWDRCIWLYPLAEWDLIDEKLQALSDFDKQSRRTKQMMRAHASESTCDAQGRVLLPQELREIAGVKKKAVFLGQGNKFEIWDAKTWAAQRDDWLRDVGTDNGAPTGALASLAL